MQIQPAAGFKVKPGRTIPVDGCIYSALLLAQTVFPILRSVRTKNPTELYA